MPTTAADNQYVSENQSTIIVEPSRTPARDSGTSGSPIRLSLSELAGRIALFIGIGMVIGWQLDSGQHPGTQARVEHDLYVRITHKF